MDPGCRGLGGLAGMNQIQGTVTTGFDGYIDGGIGFDAITGALLGRSRAWGVFAAGILFGAFKAGGFSMQAAQGVPIEIIQKYVNEWYTASLDLFGGEDSSNAATYFAASLKGRFQESDDKRWPDHLALEGVYEIDAPVGGELVGDVAKRVHPADDRHQYSGCGSQWTAHVVGSIQQFPGCAGDCQRMFLAFPLRDRMPRAFQDPDRALGYPPARSDRQDLTSDTISS